MESKYKKQNEGRYTTLYDFTKLSLLERTYFLISPTTIVVRKLLTVLDRHIDQNKKTYKILDLGCGGGIKDLSNRGEVWGVDISEKSLNNARKVYKKVVKADLSKKFPFLNESFDVVFCSEVYGHIGIEDKNYFLSEIKRILKKKGVFIFSCETKGDNWLTRYLRKNGTYDKLWIEYDGHIGLEPPIETIKRFKEKFYNVKFSVNNTYIFTIDELITVFPFLSYVFFRPLLRRIGNLAIAPCYWFSINLLFTLKSANNICIYGNK
jgi:SAM-dependent methyltransferase